ncbi:MAG TPA: hypothetical protein VN578_02545 [Candidatus Binatia bacterium]|jgi:hypothetical protein|nr:hypothetical protein [Candidatus Binatia bacterium]
MNMKKQYRAELATLARSERKITRDYQQYNRAITKQIRALTRVLLRGERLTACEMTRIQRRRAILEGRLNS